MSRRVIAVVSGFLMLAAAVGFPGGCDDEGGDDKISLQAAVPDPVTVDLGLVTGRMVFDFSADPLDVEDTTALIQLLTTGVITLTLNEEDNGVEYELSQGEFVNTDPEAPGEYQVYLAQEGSQVVVVFYNTFDGLHVRAGGEYTAVVGVAANDIFATETFTRSVTAE